MFQRKMSTASAGFLLGLLFDPEDIRTILIRNVGFTPKYTSLQLRRPYPLRMNLIVARLL
jgi:hypothetical protein